MMPAVDDTVTAPYQLCFTIAGYFGKFFVYINDITIKVGDRYNRYFIYCRFISLQCSEDIFMNGTINYRTENVSECIQGKQFW